VFFCGPAPPPPVLAGFQVFGSKKGRKKKKEGKFCISPLCSKIFCFVFILIF